jgi:hypothetical protein
MRECPILATEFDSAVLSRQQWEGTPQKGHPVKGSVAAFRTS